MGYVKNAIKLFRVKNAVVFKYRFCFILWNTGLFCSYKESRGWVRRKKIDQKCVEWERYKGQGEERVIA